MKVIGGIIDDPPYLNLHIGSFLPKERLLLELWVLAALEYSSSDGFKAHAPWKRRLRSISTTSLFKNECKGSAPQTPRYEEDELLVYPPQIRLHKSCHFCFHDGKMIAV